MNLLTLGKESIIYGLGSILIRLTTFALLPIYTNTFSPEEYGIISLGYVFLGFMTVVLHFGLDAALLKFYKSCKKREQSIYVTNTYIFLLLATVTPAIVVPTPRVITSVNFPRSNAMISFLVI